MDREQNQGIQKRERGVRQICVFSPALFSLCNEIILKEQEKLPAFIISRYKIHDNMLLADSDGNIISKTK